MNLSVFFFIEEYHLWSTFLIIYFFLATSIFIPLYFLKWCSIFTQLTARLKNFLMGWLLALSLKEGLLLVLGLKEGLVECATLCVKSEVILMHIYTYVKQNKVRKCVTWWKTRFILSICKLDCTNKLKSSYTLHTFELNFRQTMLYETFFDDVWQSSLKKIYYMYSQFVYLLT